MTAAISGDEKYAASSDSSEGSDILDLKGDEGWEDAEPDVESIQFKSLLDDEVFTDVYAMLKHCKDIHGFDFLALRKQLALDFYGNIKLVNFIRSRKQAGEKVTSLISKNDFEDEKFLKPVLEDDALLFSLDELPDVEHSEENGDSGNGQLVARVSELEEELRRMQSKFDDYRTTVKETLDERWNDKTPAGPSTIEEKEEKRDDDSHYFSSYSYNGQSSQLRSIRL